MLRRLRLITLYSVAALLVLVTLLYLSVINPVYAPLRDPLVRLGTRLASRALNGSVELGALRGSLLSAPVLHDVVLRNAQGEAVVQIAQLRLAYDLTTLFRRHLTIQAIEIVRPQVTVLQDQDGHLNLQDLLPASASPPPAQAESSGGLPISLALDKLHIRDGQLTVRLAALPGVQHITGLQLQLSAQLDQEGMRVQFQEGKVRLTPADVTLHTLRGAFQRRGGVIQMEDIRIQTDDTLVTAHGTVPGGGQRADMSVQLQPLDLAEIGRLTQNDLLRDPLRLRLNATGPPDAVQIAGQLRLPAGHVTLEGHLNTAALPMHYRMDLGIAHLNLAALLGRSTLQSDLNVHLAVQGQGFALPELQSTVHLDIQPSHLGEVTFHPSVLQATAVSQKIQVQRLDLHTSVARLTASGSLDLNGMSDLQYGLATDIAGLRTLLGIQELAGELTLQGQATGAWPDLRVQGTLQGARLRYQTHAVQALAVTYDGTHLGEQPQVTAQVLLSKLQAAGLPVDRIALTAAYQGAARQAQMTLEVVQAANAGGVLRGTVTLGENAQQVSIDELRINLPNRPWQAVTPLRLVREAQRLDLGKIQLTHAEETLSLSGGLEGEQFRDLTLQIAQLDLSYLQQLLHLPPLVGGRATLNVQLAGTLAAPQLRSDLTWRAAAQQAVPFEQARLTLAYTQQRVQAALQLQQASRDVVTLALRLPLDLALTGLTLEQRLLTAPVDIQLALQQPNLAAWQRLQPTLPALTGTLQGTVSLLGTYASLQLEANLLLQQLGLAGTVERLQGPIQLTGKLVTADTVAALVQAMQRGQLAPQGQNFALRLPSLTGQLPARDGAAQPFQVDNVVLDATAQWSPTGLQGTLQRLQAQATGLFGMPRTDLALEAHWTPQRLDVSRLQVRLPQSSLQVQGYLTFPAQQMQWRCDITRLQLNELPLALPATVPTLVQGVLTVRGSVASPQLEADIQYAGGQVRTEVALQLQEALPRYNVALRLQGIDLAQLLPRAQGRLHAGVRLQGTGFAGDKRRATLELTVDTDQVNLAPGLMVRLQASVAGDTLQLPRLQLQSTPVVLTASGTFSPTKQTALEYRLTFGDLTPLAQYLGVALQATGSLTGKLSGTRGALQTQLAMQVDNGRVADLSLQRLQITFAASQLLSDPRATLQAHVHDLQAPSLPPTSLRLDVARTPQQGTFTLAAIKGPYERTTLSGTLTFPSQGQRLVFNTLRLHYQDLAWENNGPVDILRQTQGQVNIQRFVLRSGTQEVLLKGSVVPSGALQTELQLRRLQIQPLLKAFAPAAATGGGQVDLTLRLSGTVPQPHIQGEFQIAALQWQQQKLGDIRGTVGLRDETVRTEVRWQDQGRQLLLLQGTLGTQAEAPVNVQVQVQDLDLALLSSLTPAVTHSAGALGLDVQVTGSPRKPQLRGHLTLRDGAVQPAVTGERYKDIQAQIVFAENRIDIPRFQIGSRSGPLQLTGQIAHADLVPGQVDLTLRARNFTAMHTAAIETIVSMDVQAHGPLDGLTVNGTVTVPRARVVIDNLPNSGPKAVEPWELTVPGVYGRGPRGSATAADTPTQPDTTGLLPSLQAELKIDLPRNVWVQGSGTAVEMRGDLRVTKQRQEDFIVSGVVETVRGFVTFYGKKFTSVQGNVTFTGSPEINPLLDISLNKQIAEYAVTVHAGGKARQPEITMRSVPELEQLDIIALIVVGKTTDKLSSGEQGSLGKQAQQLAGGILASEVEGAVGNALGLDTIELTTDSAKVGRYVTQDLFLSYERGFGGKDSGNTVEAEYSINRRLKLKGSGSDTGETALDVFWRLDY